MPENGFQACTCSCGTACTTFDAGKPYKQACDSCIHRLKGWTRLWKARVPGIMMHESQQGNGLLDWNRWCSTYHQIVATHWMSNH